MEIRTFILKDILCREALPKSKNIMGLLE